MEAGLKKILKAVTLELRHRLEGYYDSAGDWKPGDLEDRLSSIGVWRDRDPIAADELDHLHDHDKQARKVVDAYLSLRREAGTGREEAVAEFVRETAYTWANRLLALRCMESRELIDEVILQKEVYGGRSLEHNRLAQRQPELCTGEDDGLFAVLDKVFRERATTLPMLFDPDAPAIALRPSPAALKQCVALVSGTLAVRGNDPVTGEVFKAPDALGWAYQYWNTEEKDRVFEKVRTVKGAKIAGADIIPATQLYTEDYMVKFLVQNSLGAIWMGIHPESRLYEQLEYYVRDADRSPAQEKAVAEITFLDPACGSGHFLIEAFDLYYAMYTEEGELTNPEEICRSILENNLFGIDIDERAVQIAEAALWMKAAERACEFDGVPTGLVAAVFSHLKGKRWEEFLKDFEKEPSVARVLRKFGQSMDRIDETGSLARPSDDLGAIIKDEHAIWERQVREQREANYLFAEMRTDALSGQLPFHDITDDDFGERLFYRAKAGVDAFTKRARENGEFDDQMLAGETRAGFRLLELLSQEYDVVAANPPYMGAKDMGTSLKSFLNVAYTVAKSDLYAAFISRCQSLTNRNGFAALVTMHSFFYTSRYAAFRQYLLDRHHLVLGLHLGGFAFEEMGDHVFAVCTIWQHKCSDSHSEMTILDIRDAEDKPAATLEVARGNNWPTYRLREQRLTTIEGSPFLYDLPSAFFDLFESQPTIGDSEDILVREGVHSKPDERFRRMFWEIRLPSRRWRFLAVGGACQKWAGLDDETVEFEMNGVRLYQMPSPIVPSSDLYGLAGLSYSDAGASGFIFTCRELRQETLFSSTGPAIISRSESDLRSLMAFLNSSFASFLLDALNPGTHFKINDVKRVPYPLSVSNNEKLEVLAGKAISLKRELLSRDVTSRDFVSSALPVGPLAEGLVTRYLSDLEIQRETVAVEIAIDDAVAETIGLPTDALEHVRSTYRPAFSGVHTHTDVRSPNASELSTLSPQNVRFSQDERKTFAEYPCQVLALREGCSTEVATAALRRAIRSGPVSSFGTTLTADLVSESILRILGFSWPNQANANEFLLEWVDSDGIATLTHVAHELPLVDRLHIDASTFAEVMGKPLETWLATEFFSHHVKQFKKRPIVWQLQSGSFTARHTPAFGCFLSCQRVDSDSLPKIRSQYLGPLRQRMETEQRGITSVAADSRTDRQEQRRVELDDSIAELQKFDSTMEAVITSGFGPKSVIPKHRQDAIDDAMLALKARWLCRLSELIEKTSLTKWLNAADRSGLHPELADWIKNAMTHLNHFCASVGPKAPDQEKLQDDPTSPDLVAIISPTAESMMELSLKMACRVWWKPFDEAVLQPLNEEIKQLKAELKECQAAIKSDPPPTPIDTRKLKARVKEIKEEVKALNAEVAEKSAPALAIREHIEDWRSDEPRTWGKWLAEQPLFDQISSLDERRTPPATIAEFIAQESLYAPDINDGVRVNIAPLQKAGLLAADVLAKKDLDKAIADRAEWRSDERRWVRQGKLPKCGWWPEAASEQVTMVSST